MMMDRPHLTIGIDASRAGTERQTGTERYSSRIIQEVLDAGVDQEFRLYLNQRMPLPLRQRAGTTQKSIPFPRLWTHFRLSMELARHSVDALFVPAHVVPPVHPAATVVTIHDLGYLHEPGAHTDRARRYLHWSTRWSVKAARRIIAISNVTKKDLVDFYHVDPAKIDVIYHGVDEQFQPAAPGEIVQVRHTFGIEGSFILFVGTIQPRKNLARLVVAFDALAKDHDGLHLVLAGRMGWKTEGITQAIANARYRDRILMPGHVPDADLPALYSAASAVAMPSLYEGFGLPVLEAMACGTPVLISDRGSLPEIAGNAAVIVDPTSVDQIVAGLSTLLDKDKRAARIECGRRRAATFTWRNAGAQTLTTILNSYSESVS